MTLGPPNQSFEGCGMCRRPVATVCIMCFQKERAEAERLRAGLTEIALSELQDTHAIVAHQTLTSPRSSRW